MSFAFNPDRRCFAARSRISLRAFFRHLRPAATRSDLPRALVLRAGRTGLGRRYEQSQRRTGTGLRLAEHRARQMGRADLTRRMCCCSRGWSAQSSLLQRRWAGARSSHDLRRNIVARSPVAGASGGFGRRACACRHSTTAAAPWSAKRADLDLASANELTRRW